MNTDSHYKRLVVEAEQRGQGFALDAAVRKRQSEATLKVWARELDAVNKHITVDERLVNDAAHAYQSVGRHILDKSGWGEGNIEVHCQGSMSTQTLIAPATPEKFDIDAVCSAEISAAEARDPMAFFEKVGGYLDAWETESKNRCWRIHFVGARFYIDFTPAVPLSTAIATFNGPVRFTPGRFSETALAVVDTATKEWKTSNPKGFAAWVNQQANRQLLVSPLTAALDERAAGSADVEPVPDQSVPLSDTLRVAIRLFKRHRDMCVLRGLIDGDHKPISVVIVTLLTSCYEGLADAVRRFHHPIDLLVRLAELMPQMVEIRNGDYWIENPTVDGENFAERWNDDEGERRAAFVVWCRKLVEDLEHVIDAETEAEVKSRVQEVFGCKGATTGPKPSGGGGLANSTPTKVAIVPAGRGLA